MIISLNELIEMCVDSTNGAIPIKTLMEEYHLRFEEKRFSVPVNHIKIDKLNKAIVLCFKQENIFKGIDGDVK